MPKKERLSMKSAKVTFTIPQWILEAIDEVAEEIDGSRSDVARPLLEYCFQTEGVLDDVFPYEDEDEESDQDEETDTETDGGEGMDPDKDSEYRDVRPGEKVRGGLY